MYLNDHSSTTDQLLFSHQLFNFVAHSFFNIVQAIIPKSTYPCINTSHRSMSVLAPEQLRGGHFHGAKGNLQHSYSGLALEHLNTPRDPKHLQVFSGAGSTGNIKQTWGTE